MADRIDHNAKAKEWLAIAETDYENRHYDRAHAASRISVAHAAVHDLDHPLSVDYLGQQGPTGAQRAAGEGNHQ